MGWLSKGAMIWMTWATPRTGEGAHEGRHYGGGKNRGPHTCLARVRASNSVLGEKGGGEGLAPDSSRGIGMTGDSGVSFWGGRDGLAVVIHPPLILRVPEHERPCHLGWIPARGAG